MSDAQREILERLAKSQTAAHREVTRAKALLLAADGLASTAVAYEVGVSPSSVVAWRSRFAEEGLAKLGRVRPGRGRKPQIPAEKIDEIVRLTQESKPEGETHWSCRSMAKAAVTDLSQRSRAQIRVQVTMSRVGAKTNDLPDESI
jgi:transposase